MLLQLYLLQTQALPHATFIELASFNPIFFEDKFCLRLSCLSLYIVYYIYIYIYIYIHTRE